MQDGNPLDASARGSPARAIRLLLVGFVLCRGIAYLCVLPPFEGWDEYQHVAYVVHVIETGRAAVLGETNVPRSLLEAMIPHFPQPKDVVDHQLGRFGAVTYGAFWSRPGMPAAPRLDRGQLKLYQAQHAPFYYSMVAPVFRALGGVSHLRWSVGGLRLINLLLTAGAVWVTLGALGRLVRDRRDAALIGLPIAAHPLFLINGVRVSNDALGVFLASVAIAMGLTLEERRLLPRCAGIGVVIGLATLGKAVNLALVPFAVVCWLAVVVREPIAWRRAAAAGLLMTLGFLTVVQSEWRGNLERYGALVSMQEAVLNRGLGRSPADLLRVAASFDWFQRVSYLWLHGTFFAGGWSHVNPPWGMYRQVYGAAILTGLFNAACRLLVRPRAMKPVFRETSTPIACTMLCLSVTAALAYHMIQSKLIWGRPTTPPWYACVALPWFLALVTGAGLAWSVRPIRSLVPWALTASSLLVEVMTLWGKMVPTYSGCATGREALLRLASLQPAIFGTATLVIAVVSEVLILTVLAILGIRAGSGPVTSPVSGLRGSRPDSISFR